jgi:hypothetical protein
MKNSQDESVGYLAQLKTKQYWLWVGPMAIAFAAVVLILQAVNAPMWGAVAAGIIFDELSDPYLDWLQGWLRAEREVSWA